MAKRNFTSNASATPIRTIRNPKAIQAKSRTHAVIPTGPDTYRVISGHSGEKYTVDVYEQGSTCSCPWQTKRKSATFSGCSHVVSVYNFIAKQVGRTVSAWGSAEDARRQHRKVLDIGDGVTITARLAPPSVRMQPAPIIWTIQDQEQDQVHVLEMA